MPQIQLKDFVLAKSLDGTEKVYISQNDNTRSTTINEIGNNLLGNEQLETNALNIKGAINELNKNIDELDLIVTNNRKELVDSINQVDSSLNILANDKAGVVKGIWTPLLSGSSGECTYEKQEGHYIKIDDLVICTFNLKIATVNTLAGYLAIKGFPFTPVKNAPLLTGAINNIKTTAQLPIGGTLEIDGSCYLKHNALNTFSSALSGTDISDGFDMVCCQVIYRM